MLHRTCRDRWAAQSARITELHREIDRLSGQHRRQLDRARRAEDDLEQMEMSYDHLLEEIHHAVADPEYARGEAVIPEVLRRALRELERWRSQAP